MPQITVKICSKCKLELEFSCFSNHKTGKFGLNSICKKCKKEQDYTYRKANSEKIKQHKRAYHESNPEKAKERSRTWYELNSRKAKERASSWRAANPEKTKELIRAWRAANPERIKELARAWRKKEIKNNPVYAMKIRIRSLIYLALKNKDYTKESSAFEILGCDYQSFTSHIEAQFTNGMSWDVIERIHLDHKIPLASAKTEEDVLRLNHYSNLQPLWAIDNLKKGAKMPHELT
jgi:hypothetical protein